MYHFELECPQEVTPGEIFDPMETETAAASWKTKKELLSLYKIKLGFA